MTNQKSQKAEGSVPRDRTASEAQDTAHAIAELALIRVDAVTPEQTLRRVADLARRSLSNVIDVSITLIADGHPSSLVFTGELAVDLDERQYEPGFGPCLDAAITGRTVIVNEDDDGSPYRDFASLAARVGVRYTVAVGMPITEHSSTALNIYCNAEPADPQRFLEQAEVLAAYASVVINNLTKYAEATNRASNLLKAMESRAVIEQAKGIIMARDRCTADEAFELLTRTSQHQNVKLRKLAQTVVDSAQNGGTQHLDLGRTEQ